jgi:chorismate synthase
VISFSTAGESHGPALAAIIEGVPAGVPLAAADVDAQLARRQQGYGRGRRMQIETDTIELLSGVRGGQTLGSPIGMVIRNRDARNWMEIMDPALREGEATAESPGGTIPPRKRVVTRVRPGHADLSGMLKYDRADARDVLERASARETTARVAAGAICRRFLEALDIRIGSHVVHLGGIDARRPDVLPHDLNAASDASPLRTLDPEADSRMVELIDITKRQGNTLGGIAEVVCTGLPVGLGSHVSWDRKLDGRIAQAMMSIHAVKGVEIGLGFDGARRPGSDVHDAIAPSGGPAASGGVSRTTNRAGGLEGGITTGEPLVVRVAMKPIATLMRPMGTVDVQTGQEAQAVAERSDVTAVPAMAVIAEAMLALVVADAMLEKFGGDSLAEVRRNRDGYLAAVGARIPR